MLGGFERDAMDIVEELRFLTAGGTVPGWASRALAEINNLRAENSMLRTGDTCARLCEGTAYRIELRKLRAAANEALDSGNDGDWQTARRILASALPPNAKG